MVSCDQFLLTLIKCGASALFVAFVAGGTASARNEGPMNMYARCKDTCRYDRIVVTPKDDGIKDPYSNDRGHDALNNGGKERNSGEGKDTLGQSNGVSVTTKIATYEKSKSNYTELETKLSTLISDIDRAQQARQAHVVALNKQIEDFQHRIDTAEETTWKKLEEAAESVKEGLERELKALKDPKGQKIIDKAKSAKDAWEAAKAENDSYQAMLDAEILPDEVERLKQEVETVKAEMKRHDELKQKAQAVLDATIEARKAVEERLIELNRPS